MSEGDPGPSDTGGGVGSFRTSLPALLTASAVLRGAIVSAFGVDEARSTCGRF